MHRGYSTSALLCVFLCVDFLGANLTINGEKCGQISCNRTQHCDPYTKKCEPCAKICDPSSHNFDEFLCIEKCQDYLHDNRYVVKDDSATNANLRETVQHLSHMVNGVLTLVCLILLALVIVLFIQVYRWKKKKNITLQSIKEKFKKKSESGDKSNGHPEKPELRIVIPAPVSHSDNSPVTMSTAISRRPTEDSALDYAYDNPAINTEKSF